MHRTFTVTACVLVSRIASSLVPCPVVRRKLLLVNNKSLPAVSVVWTARTKETGDDRNHNGTHQTANHDGSNNATCHIIRFRSGVLSIAAQFVCATVCIGVDAVRGTFPTNAVAMAAMAIGTVISICTGSISCGLEDRQRITIRTTVSPPFSRFWENCCVTSMDHQTLRVDGKTLICPRTQSKS